MFVTISKYRAKAGEEDAIIALHEDWQRHEQPRAKGYLSGELLRSVNDPSEFVAVTHFDSRESAQVLANDPEQQAWYQRLISLTECLPMLTEHVREWPNDSSVEITESH